MPATFIAFKRKLSGQLGMISGHRFFVCSASKKIRNHKISRQNLTQPSSCSEQNRRYKDTKMNMFIQRVKTRNNKNTWTSFPARETAWKPSHTTHRTHRTHGTGTAKACRKIMLYYGMCAMRSVREDVPCRETCESHSQREALMHNSCSEVGAKCPPDDTVI
jgi:hypothetical protein